MIYIIYAILTIISTIIHILIEKTPFAETLLLYTLIICVGVSGILGFYYHAFKADWTAKYIGWATGNPFQFEIAVANLGTGICGILCIWFHDGFWLATIIAYSVFSLGAAYGHIVEIKKAKNYAPGNAGPVLYYDIIVPIVLICLFITSYIIK
jgi:hypothetical protein